MSAPEWRQVEKWAGEQIEAARTALENPIHDAAATALWRGRIAVLRDLLKLNQPAPQRNRPDRQPGNALTGGPADRYS
jgi:pSer/pThr/pTyr-binding forkhead associated (FHA) protein